MSENTSTLAERLDATLRAERDPERAANEKRYLKSPIEHYGVRVPAIRRSVGALLRSRPDLTRRTFLALVRRLWSSDVHEQRMAAVFLLEGRPDLLEASDLPMIEDMIRGSFTWAYVDSLAGRVAGRLIDDEPELASELDRWSTDQSFWIRRASMLALMGGLRRGEGDWDRFTRYADAMLDEKEFFIRKAIGWVLRETSKKRPGLVRDYVASRLDRLSGLTFREAVKRLPPTDRTALERARGELS